MKIGMDYSIVNKKSTIRVFECQSLGFDKLGGTNPKQTQAEIKGT
jgi:hypothetical protein